MILLVIGSGAAIMPPRRDTVLSGVRFYYTPCPCLLPLVTEQGSGGDAQKQEDQEDADQGFVAHFSTSSQASTPMKRGWPSLNLIVTSVSCPFWLV